MVRSRAALLVLLLVGVTACATEGSPRASLEGRVIDRDPPAFSNPTAVTNALFPASVVTQVVQLGVDGGQPLRVEVTLMPETRTIEWDGGSIQAVVVQFIAYRNRRVIEVAYDYFAQADDGSVWYLGEDVDNYGGGRITNHSGSWLAGKDGPPGMIMPADPHVADVYHPENIPGVVFEELIVLATDVSTPGPGGTVAGAIRVEEHLMDGGVEQKIFAPGYGEFRAEASDELVTVAIAVPTDARSGPLPSALVGLRAAADQAVSGSSDAVPKLREAWDAYRADAPPLLAEQLDRPLAELVSAATGNDPFAVRQAGIDLQHAILDLELQYRSPAEIDLGRIAAWMEQLRLDADAGEGDAVRGDAVIARVIWTRSRAAVEAIAARGIEATLATLATAADAGDLVGAATAATSLLDTLSREASG